MSTHKMHSPWAGLCSMVPTRAYYRKLQYAHLFSCS
uniref:Uncharacterized protein n=1 Tax=Anguilla anguilla TaxID=7936 RepID=A0A0E9W4P4_ANGAN